MASKIKADVESQEEHSYKEMGIVFGPALIVTASLQHYLDGVLTTLNIRSAKLVISYLDVVLRVCVFPLLCVRFAVFFTRGAVIVGLSQLQVWYCFVQIMSILLFIAERLAAKFEIDPKLRRTRFEEATDKLPFTSPLFAVVISFAYIALAGVASAAVTVTSASLTIQRDDLSMAVVASLLAAELVYTLNRLNHMHNIKVLSVYMSSLHTCFSITLAMPASVVVIYYAAIHMR